MSRRPERRLQRPPLPLSRAGLPLAWSLRVRVRSRGVQLLWGPSESGEAARMGGPPPGVLPGPRPRRPSHPGSRGAASAAMTNHVTHPLHQSTVAPLESPNHPNGFNRIPAFITPAAACQTTHRRTGVGAVMRYVLYVSVGRESHHRTSHYVPMAG